MATTSDRSLRFWHLIALKDDAWSCQNSSKNDGKERSRWLDSCLYAVTRNSSLERVSHCLGELNSPMVYADPELCLAPTSLETGNCTFQTPLRFNITSTNLDNHPTPRSYHPTQGLHPESTAQLPGLPAVADTTAAASWLPRTPPLPCLCCPRRPRLRCW